MNPFFVKTLLVLVLILSVSTGFIPVAKADTDKDDCSLSLTTSASPKTVKTWENTVDIVITLSSSYQVGYYCNTVETANVNLLVNFGNGWVSLREGIVLELPANTNNKGEARSDSDNSTFNFSLRGVSTQSSISLFTQGQVSRQSNFVGRQATLEDLRSNTVTVIKDPDTTVIQNPTSKGGSDTTKDPNNANNSNQPPNNSTPNDKIDSNTGVNFNVDPDQSLGNFFNPLSIKSAPELLGRILDILFLLIGLAAVIVIIIAGFRMVTSSGNTDQLTKAKKAITWAVIGLIVSLLSFSIVAIIQNLISR